MPAIDMGIRPKLALLVPGMVALALAGVAWVAAEGERRAMTEDMRARDQEVLEAIGVSAASYAAQNDHPAVDRLIAYVAAVRLDPDLLELSVLDLEGRVMADTEPARLGTVAGDTFSRSAIASPRPRWVREAEVLRVAVPALAGTRQATIAGRYSMARVDSAISRMRWRWFLGALSLAALLGVALFWGLDRMVIRPVRALQRTTRRMMEGHLDDRMGRIRGSELGELAEGFNKMAEALQHQRALLETTVAERTAELQEANRRLERLAVTDGLTGIFNHRRFQETLGHEVLRSARSGRPLSVLMIDVDNFKRFNDALGHPAGDALLRRLAQTLAAGLRATDFLARYGGEEFAILLPETPPGEALQVAERVRRAVEAMGERGAAVTISVGVATSSAEATSGADLLAAADRALYAAKDAGRNRVVASQAEGARANG